MSTDSDLTVVLPRSPAARPLLDRLVPPRRRVGPWTIAVLALALAVLWLAVGPGAGGTGTRRGESPWPSFLGQLAGAEAVLAMSVALVLISMLPWVETWFDGIDRAAVWHRRLALTGMVLLAPHVLLSSNHRAGQASSLLAYLALVGLLALVVWAVLPRWRALLPATLRRPVAVLEDRVSRTRWSGAVLDLARRVLGRYERWRAFHRLTGLFVAAGFVHGLLAATAFGSGWLQWTYVVLGGTGLAFYAYRETVAGRYLPLHDYQVSGITAVSRNVAELTLTPLGPPIRFVPGQFAMVYLEGKNGWHRHPFTIAGAAHDRALTFTIKGLGDDTCDITRTVRVGMPAVVGGPHGRFQHRRGTRDQVWIAGGVGVTPFLSWLRSLSHDPLRARVHFFYTNAGAAPYAEQITAIARAHPNLTVHLLDSTIDGHLSASRVLQTVRIDPRLLSVFLCGPTPMVDGLTRELRRSGVAARHMHREHFDWR